MWRGALVLHRLFTAPAIVWAPIQAHCCAENESCSLWLQRHAAAPLLRKLGPPLAGSSRSPCCSPPLVCEVVEQIVQVSCTTLFYSASFLPQLSDSIHVLRAELMKPARLSASFFLSGLVNGQSYAFSHTASGGFCCC